VLVLGLAGISGASGAPSSAELDRRYEAAREAYAIGHYAAAHAEFAALADAGHCDAARIAHLMRRHGRRLYGVDLQASSRPRWPDSCPPVPAARPG
jgi:hypothetical protein